MQVGRRINLALRHQAARPKGIEAVSKVKLNQDNRGGSAVSHDGWP